MKNDSCFSFYLFFSGQKCKSYTIPSHSYSLRHFFVVFNTTGTIPITTTTTIMDSVVVPAEISYDTTIPYHNMLVSSRLVSFCSFLMTCALGTWSLYTLHTYSATMRSLYPPLPLRSPNCRWVSDPLFVYSTVLCRM